MKPVRLMGVLNTNEDSFYKGSRFSGKEAVARAKKMIEEGAHIIDLGGISSRPGSAPVSADEELARIKPVVDAIYQERLYEKAVFSLDSYAPKCLVYALDHGFTFINDITGLANDEVAKVAAGYGAAVCIMHMQKEPATMQQNPTYDDVVQSVEDFFKERIAKATAFGIS